jgi:hypothetical protein
MNLATMFWNPRFLVLRSKSLFSQWKPVCCDFCQDGYGGILFQRIDRIATRNDTQQQTSRPQKARKIAIVRLVTLITQLLNRIVL